MKKMILIFCLFCAPAYADDYSHDYQAGYDRGYISSDVTSTDSSKAYTDGVRVGTYDADIDAAYAIRKQEEQQKEQSDGTSR